MFNSLKSKIQKLSHKPKKRWSIALAITFFLFSFDNLIVFYLELYSGLNTLPYHQSFQLKELMFGEELLKSNVIDFNTPQQYQGSYYITDAQKQQLEEIITNKKVSNTIWTNYNKGALGIYYYVHPREICMRFVGRKSDFAFYNGTYTRGIQEIYVKPHSSRIYITVIASDHPSVSCSYSGTAFLTYTIKDELLWQNLLQWIKEVKTSFNPCS